MVGPSATSSFTYLPQLLPRDALRASSAASEELGWMPVRAKQLYHTMLTLLFC